MCSCPIQSGRTGNGSEQGFEKRVFALKINYATPTEKLIIWKRFHRRVAQNVFKSLYQMVSDSRKLPVSPEGKIDKFHKLLSRFHTLYLTDCKKSRRLKEVADRFKVSRI